MGATEPVPDEQPLDLATIAADDRLLDALAEDALAHDERTASDDPIAELLTAWRADLGSGHPDVPVGLRSAGAIAAGPGDPPARPPAGDEPATGAGKPAGSGRVPARRWRRLALGVAGVGVAAGLLIAVDQAGPGSPLWPITQVLYPDAAEIRAAEESIALARTAVAEGRPDDARRRLDDAVAHAARVRDPATAQRIRAEIDTVRRLLPSGRPDGPAAPSTPAAPAAPATPAVPGPAGTPGPSGGAAPGGPASGEPAPVLPGLPPIDPPDLLPEPSLSPPLPLPTLSGPALPLPLSLATGPIPGSGCCHSPR